MCFKRKPSTLLFLFKRILSEILNLSLVDINAINKLNERPLNLAIINSKSLIITKEHYEIIDILINAHCIVTQENLKSALEVRNYLK